MESQPQNPEFRINPENFHPCICTMNPPKFILSDHKPISIKRFTLKIIQAWSSIPHSFKIFFSIKIQFSKRPNQANLLFALLLFAFLPNHNKQEGPRALNHSPDCL